MIRKLIALVLLLVSAAVLARGEGYTTIGEKTNYISGKYGAYASSYATYSAPGNTYARGVDYATNIDIRPNSFPNRTVIRSFWPAAASGVRGYIQLFFGNYDSGVKSTVSSPVQPVQISALQTFTDIWDYTLVGVPGNQNVLDEFYTTSVAGDPTTKVDEVALFHNMSDAGLTYFNSGTLVGTYSDNGLSYTVRTLNQGSAGHYIMAYSGAQQLKGQADKRALLLWLVSKGQVSANSYVNGAALGIEPVQGAVIMKINTWAVALN